MSSYAPVPYFSQFASADLIDEILSGRMRPRDDPRWHETGAPTADVYETWSRTWCGMACIQSVLRYFGHAKGPPSLYELATLAVSYGAYVERSPSAFAGLHYHECVEMLAREFDIRARVAAPLTFSELCNELSAGRLVICSVHNSIRDLRPPPTKGGHLVLAVGLRSTADGRHVIFHNPSGSPHKSQSSVILREDIFVTYFAERGIVIEPPDVPTGEDD